MQTVGMRGAQLNLFKPKELSLLPAADQTRPRKKPTQHERAFMQDIIRVAHSFGLPCIHIEYYCGNKFYVPCRKCGTMNLAECHKTLNKGLKGAPDVIGIAWAVETKHKTNKGKQVAKATEYQEAIASVYRSLKIPVITANESNAQEVVDFLVARQKETFKKEKP